VRAAGAAGCDRDKKKAPAPTGGGGAGRGDRPGRLPGRSAGRRLGSRNAIFGGRTAVSPRGQDVPPRDPLPVDVVPIRRPEVPRPRTARLSGGKRVAAARSPVRPGGFAPMPARPATDEPKSAGERESSAPPRRRPRIMRSSRTREPHGARRALRPYPRAPTKSAMVDSAPVPGPSIVSNAPSRPGPNAKNAPHSDSAATKAPPRTQ